MGNGGGVEAGAGAAPWRGAVAGADAAAAATICAALRQADAACSLPEQLAARQALSARRDLGRAGHQLRGVLGPCRADRTLPVRSHRAGAKSRASRCRNTPTRSGTAICRTPQPGCSTATAPMAPTSPSSGHRFNPNKLLLDPYAQAARRRPALVRRAVRLSACSSSRDDLSFDRRDSAAAHAEGRGDRRHLRLGRRPSARRPWADTVIYEAHVRGLTKLRDDVPAARARHLRGARRSRA